MPFSQLKISLLPLYYKFNDFFDSGKLEEIHFLVKKDYNLSESKIWSRP